MTIERGKPWGGPMTLPRSAPVVASDAELASLVRRHLDRNGDPVKGDPIVVGVTGGDLHRTLGSPRRDPQDLYDGEGMGFPIDVGVLTADELDHGAPFVFAAHLIATASRRGVLWRGRTIIVMNAAFRGAENLAPRGHPNDGRLDLIDGRLGLVDRRRALRRTTTGSHVPHPDLKVAHLRDRHFDSDEPLVVHLDASPVGRMRSFSVRCIPDAATIVV